jgi:hypothetical protein
VRQEWVEEGGSEARVGRGGDALDGVLDGSNHSARGLPLEPNLERQWIGSEL